MNLGWTEILLIGGIAMLLFGPSKLPGLGRSMGEAIRGFKKGISEDQHDETPVQQIPQNHERPVNTADAAADSTKAKQTEDTKKHS